MTTLTTQKAPICNFLLHCITCNLTCSKRSDLTRHLTTAKHKMNISSTTQKAPHEYTCECNRKYKDRAGLWRHKKKCNINIKKNDETTNPSLELLTQLVITVVKENQDFKNLIVEQNQDFKNLMLENNQDMHKQMIELASKSNNNITVNTNNQNNFNLNVFLNDTCKDAINMNDFIKNMQISTDELENVGKIGYVNGISNIIMDRINQLDISKRPLHCTDLKREIMYIRDDNMWNKDSEDNAKLRQIIKRIANKNLSKLPEWSDEHPNCTDTDNEQYDFFINLFKISLGEIGDEQIKLDSKIIKHIAKMVIVDKNTKLVDVN